MKLATFCWCSSLALLFLLISFTLFARAQEVENEREFSYDVNSEVGPSHWGELHEEWRQCNSGQMQSPIDLLTKRVEIVSNLGKLKRNYRPSNATLINRGHDMMLKWVDDAGHTLINGIPYQLRQCHWHSPSEHTINGRRFDLELHLLHQTNDNRTAVIGIMYKIGRPDSFLSTLKTHLDALVEKKNVENAVGIIDPKLVKFGSRKYYRYIGSLTTPPCTQNITWTILRKVRTVSKNQVALIRDAIHDASNANSRPTQALNERSIRLFRPNDNVN